MKQARITNRASGQSVVELLIGTLIFSAVATVLLSLYSINTMQLSQFWNKSDILTSSSDALMRLGQLTRSARGFGENYGDQPPSTSMAAIHNPFNVATRSTPAAINTNATTAGILAGTSFLVSPYFPAGGDPYYSNGQSPPAAYLPPSIYGGNWPFISTPQLGPPSGPVAPSGAGIYCLAQDTYIVQVPVFVGLPAGNAPGSLGVDPAHGTNGLNYVWPATWNNASPSGTLTMQAADTYVFRVMPDATNPGTSMMMEAAFPACPPNGNNPITGGTYSGTPTNVTLNPSQPVIVVKGIVGPLDNNNNISTFQYVEKVNNTATVNPPAAGHFTSDYTGLIVNLELLKNEQGARSAVAAFRSEFYVRNNNQAENEGPAVN